jgi:hypothetical protein
MGVVLNVAPMIGVLLTSRFWGGVIKKYGNRPVVRMGSFALIFIPIVWLTAGANSTPVLFVFLFMSGVFFCALELTNQNLMVGLARHIPRSTITALLRFVPAPASPWLRVWVDASRCTWKAGATRFWASRW